VNINDVNRPVLSCRTEAARVVAVCSERSAAEVTSEVRLGVPRPGVSRLGVCSPVLRPAVPWSRWVPCGRVVELTEVGGVVKMDSLLLHTTLTS